MKKTLVIVGGGVSALALAAFLDPQKFEVTLFEKNKALGRKFLVAGKGGFNLTHSEEIESFINRYTPTSFLGKSLKQFSNQDFRDWLNSIGIPTYVGSSKRVYPEASIKPIEVLKAIENVLAERQVKVNYDHNWTAWESENNLLFNDAKLVESDYTVFALGGGSWKVTGSDGSWLPLFEKKGIKTNPFRASNCGYQVEWKKEFIDKHEGTPLKNIAISCSTKKKKGEVVITRFGLEGNAIYALSPEIRSNLVKHQQANIRIDLKPSLREEEILLKLKKAGAKKTTEILKRELKLSPAQIALLKSYVSKEDFLKFDKLAFNIKNLPLTLVGSAPLDEAISTVGGICLSELDANFQLRKMKKTYCIGEMLDWDAPTGGYLLQACFSMGVHLAKHLNGEV